MDSIKGKFIPYNIREISFINMMECGKKIREELNLTDKEIYEMLVKDTKLNEQERPCSVAESEEEK